MTQTQTEIATLALRVLVAFPAHQAPNASQMAIASAGVARAHAELAHHRIAYWSLDACPDSVASAFADYIAGDIAHSIVGEERAPRYQARMTGAMRRMAAVTAKPDYSDAPVKIVDF